MKNPRKHRNTERNSNRLCVALLKKQIKCGMGPLKIKWGLDALNTYL